jgi:CRISPR system Cascade subunit CasB
MESAKENPKSFPSDEIYQWWYDMQPANEGPGKPNRRGELAELRRCKTLTEILLVPQFQSLRRVLQSEHFGYIPACAAVAGVLAHVKTHQETDPFAVWLAQSKAKGAGPRLSELRFRRLIRLQSHDDLFTEMVRVLTQADATANVRQLARDVYFWNDRTRRDWTFGYYDAGAAQE